MGEARDESLVIVGAGFGRTGTLSMKAALEHLGLGPCHHMLEAFGRPADFDHWAAAVRGEAWDRDAVLDGFRCTLDFPACLVWQELWEANPGAKVLLTVRSADSWWRSFDATIGPELRHARFGPGLEGARRLFDAIEEVVFDGRSAEREVAVAAYEAHNRRVIDTVPSGDLLVHELGGGWDPLCGFLGVPVPSEPFPSVNSTSEFTAARARR